MVNTKTALITSLISALIIGAIHYFAHQYFKTNTIMYVGLTIVISVFILSFFGMKWNDWFG